MTLGRSTALCALLSPVVPVLMQQRISLPPQPLYLSVCEAMSACSKAGGCTLTFPGPGIYISGPIQLVSNLTLVIAKGATLHGARTIAGWPVLPYSEW